MDTQLVKVAYFDDGKVRWGHVVGHGFGPLSVTPAVNGKGEPISGEWVVTHVRTGAKIGNSRGKREAVSLAKKLLRKPFSVDWWTGITSRRVANAKSRRELRGIALNLAGGF